MGAFYLYSLITLKVCFPDQNIESSLFLKSQFIECDMENLLCCVIETESVKSF